MIMKDLEVIVLMFGSTKCLADAKLITCLKLDT